MTPKEIVTQAFIKAGYGQMPKLEFELKHAIEEAIAAEREACAKVCDEERSEYQKSMEEFDRRGDTTMGTNEARCAATAQSLAERIRARK